MLFSTNLVNFTAVNIISIPNSKIYMVRQWIISAEARVYILRSVYTFFAELYSRDPGTRRHLIFGLFSPHSFLISASSRHATNCISFEKFGFVITTHNFSCSKLPWWLKGYFSCLSTMRPVCFESFFGMISTIWRLESSVSVYRTKKLNSIAVGSWQTACFEITAATRWSAIK